MELDTQPCSRVSACDSGSSNYAIRSPGNGAVWPGTVLRGFGHRTLLTLFIPLAGQTTVCRNCSKSNESSIWPPVIWNSNSLVRPFSSTVMGDKTRESSSGAHVLEVR
eukprot:1773103-Rhodomonas_salina.2